MKILIEGSRGGVSIDWSDYALLRDNVQHFLEGGHPSARFAAIHALEQAIDSGRTVVDAPRLRGEVLGACYGLRNLDLQDCAVSLRTRARLTRCNAPPLRRGTARAAATGWSLPAKSGTGPVLEHLRRLVASLLAVTETAVDGDRIVARRAGTRRPNRAPRRGASSVSAQPNDRLQARRDAAGRLS
jgi:hypothetical protein